jgi:hypothetical protein
MAWLSGQVSEFAPQKAKILGSRPLVALRYGG